MICSEDDPEGAPERRSVDNGEDYPPVFISSGPYARPYGADPSMCDPRYGFIHNLAS